MILLFGEGNKPLFSIAALLILSFYGGGFATIPAYLKDLFGTYQVGAIHGRLLTAWSAAGVLGPLIVNADRRRPRATSRARRSTRLSFTIMIGLLAVGFVANELDPPRRPEVLRARLRARRRRGRRGVRVRSDRNQEVSR